VADKYPEKVKELENCSGKRLKSTMSTLSAVPWAECCSRNPIRNGPPRDTGS
jgi:hypothetical protein